MQASWNAGRVTSGVPGLDVLLDGGFVAGHSYLLAGAPGAGKTILSLQWLLEGVRTGQRSTFISLCEPGEGLSRNVSPFGWSLNGVDVVDLSPRADSFGDIGGEYKMFPPNEIEGIPAWNSIYEAVRRAHPQRLVIDSVTQLRYLATDEYQFRKNILSLVNFLDGAGATSLLVFDPSELEREHSVALAVDGILRLHSHTSPALDIGLRSFQVDKMRGSKFVSGRHPLRIGPAGMNVFPHLIEHTGAIRPGERAISSGIAKLDELLGGGIESGTTTLLTGPTGTGKSTLGTQFLAHHARTSRAMLFTFEEPESFIVARSRGVGQPIDDVIESGALKIVRINPLELYPDEFLQIVRHAVEVDDRGMVMIDSLRGYELAMQEFGKPQAHIHNLVAYLSRRGATTILINEVEHITSTSLKATDLGVSHLADNIVLLRYAEFAGKVIKIVGCLKKRVGNFEPELRQMELGPSGIQLSEKLDQLQGILTGVPSIATAGPAAE